MSLYKIAVLVGSLRRESLNRKLAHAMAVLAPSDFTFEQLQIDDLPLYNQDDDSHYNRSIPGLLQNAIDHASRPYGQSAWSGKPAGVLGVSVGAMGTALAQQHLRNILAYLDVPTLGQPEAFIHGKDGLFAPDGSIGDTSKKFLQDWMDHYVAWIKKFTPPPAVAQA